MRKQFGRSMIEMLGVLAIIGVLSIGGIALYRRAVNNHHANTILDDVNRFAFAIIEKGNYPLDSILSKGDFKESGIYELEAFQDLSPQQFSITVRNVPYGVCDALLEKAAVEYAVRVKEHGSDTGPLYDLFHTDLCHDNNDIVLYFGDTDDLFDFPECGRLPNCTKYSSDCKCIECENGYQLSKDNSSDPDGQYCVANSCKSTGVEGCTSNADCCKSTDFCSWEQATSCTEVSNDIGIPTGITTGVCTSVNMYGTGTGSYTKTVTTGGVLIKFVRSKNNMKWWSAKNWCERQKRDDGSSMSLAYAADLGCSYFPEHFSTGTCVDSNVSGKEGVVLALLQSSPAPTWISDQHWLNDKYSDSCRAYTVDSNSLIHRHTRSNYNRALCR